MANNPYVNKVQKADGTTILDISDTTAVASDVATGKYFYLATGQKVQGTSTSGGYITQDANGYIVLSPTSGLPTLITKSITQNGTYAASSDSATGYSSVTVNVQSSGGSMNATHNCDTDANTHQTLTVYNVQSAPSKFVLVFDYLGDYDSIGAYGGCICSAYYDGTSTDARVWMVNGTRFDVYKFISDMGTLTWSYNSNSHVLTFTATGYFGFNDSSVSNGFGYTLYYS